MADSGTALFLYRNLVDGATLTASSAVTPVDRLKDFRPTRQWVTVGDAGEYVLIDNGASENMTHGAVVAYSLNATGTIRCRVSDDPLFTTNPDDAELLVDETKEAWAPVAGLGDDGFGSSLGGYPILTGINDYRPYCVFDYGGLVTARWTRFDVTNPGLGQIKVGRAFTGLGFQPEWGIDFNWSWEWVDPSEQIDTEESLFILRRKKHRVLRLSLPDLTGVEATQKMDDLKRIVGKSRDLLVVLFPRGAVPLQYRTTIYGVPPETSGISNPHVDLYATTLAVRELAR